MSDRASGGPIARRRLATLLPLAALALACAGAPRPLPAPEAGERPWLLPASAYGTQRLFRCSYRGPGGDGGFRATLRLASPDRFDLPLVDPLGRQLASLRVDGESALLVDHRRGTHCGRLDAVSLPGIGPLPLRPREMPAVLMGALPAAPADPAAEPGESLELDDASGRHWRARIEEGLVAEWSVRQDRGMPWTWRRRAGRGATLSAPGGPQMQGEEVQGEEVQGQQVQRQQVQRQEVQWQEVVVEPLRSALPPVAPPAGSEESCVLDDAGRAEP